MLPKPELTPREKQVLILLANGKHNKEIADALSISEHTAKFHVNAIMIKTGQHSRLGTVIFCMKHSIIKLNDLMTDITPPVLPFEPPATITIPPKENIDDVINKMDNLVNDIAEGLHDNHPDPDFFCLDDEDKAMIKNIIQQYYPANV